MGDRGDVRDVGETTLRGRRVLVVGASAGIGRAFALHAIRAGADVVVGARRGDRLAELIGEAGGGTAVTGDVSEPGDVERMVGEAVAHLGAIDVVFVSVGYAQMGKFADTTAEQWDRTLRTNLVGIHQLIRAALPSLAPGAMVTALSSEAVTMPRSYMGAYRASKVALNSMLEQWRIEHPGIRFGCVTVGATQPTEFGVAFDMDLLPAALTEWTARGLSQEEFMDTDEVAAVLVGFFGLALAFPGVGMEHLVLRSPSAVITNASGLVDYAIDNLA